MKNELRAILSKYPADKVWMLRLKKEYVRAVGLDGKLDQEFSSLSNEDLETFNRQLAAQVGLPISNEAPHGLAFVLPDGTAIRFMRTADRDVLIDVFPFHK